MLCLLRKLFLPRPRVDLSVSLLDADDLTVVNFAKICTAPGTRGRCSLHVLGVIWKHIYFRISDSDFLENQNAKQRAIQTLTLSPQLRPRERSDQSHVGVEITL